jgi:hypothetical protein
MQGDGGCCPTIQKRRNTVMQNKERRSTISNMRCSFSSVPHTHNSCMKKSVRVRYELCRYRNDLLVSHTIQTILPPGCTIHRKAKENTTFSLHTQEEGSSAISAPIPRSFKRVMEAGMKRTSTRPIDKTTSSA